MADGSDQLAYLSGIENDLIAHWREKSKAAIYQTDPAAWLADVLGYRWHSKQLEIADNFVNNRRTATKSSNGSGKTRQYGELATWGLCTHEPGQLFIIASSPSALQLKNGLFGYIDKNINRAKGRGQQVPPGYLTGNNEWNYRPPGSLKAKTLMLGRTPPRQDIIGTFQGIRAIADDDVKTWVFIDEGGAVHDDLYDAAEAVTTGAGDNKIAVIGNPDRIGTFFQRIFEDKRIMPDWASNTISAYDLPTFTGEIVYPDDPEMQRQMLESGMIDKAWVEKNRRAWGEDSARFKSKALGEFPDADDLSFFSQIAINTAEDTQIEPDPTEGKVIGADVADYGDDDCKVYRNHSGQIRHLGTWNHRTPVETKNRIHRIATEEQAEIVVIDRMGNGSGVHAELRANARTYTVIGAAAGESSPDPGRWDRVRAYWYDRFREGMLNGEIDLDFEEIDEHGNEVGTQLKNEILAIRYTFTERGAIQIEPKKEMRKRGLDSPDALDAAVFSFSLSAKERVEDPLAEADDGDIVEVDPYELFDDMPFLI